MADFKKTQGKNQSIRGLLLSSAFIILVIVTLSFIAAIICNITQCRSDGIKIYALGVLIASALISGFVNSKRGGVKEALFASLFISLIMLLLGIILSGGKIAASAFMNYGCFLLISVAGSYLGRRRDSKPRHKRRHK